MAAGQSQTTVSALVAGEEAREHGATQDPGTDSEQNAHDRRNDPNLGLLPLDRLLGDGCVIVSDGNG